MKVPSLDLRALPSLLGGPGGAGVDEKPSAVFSSRVDRFESVASSRTRESLQDQLLRDSRPLGDAALVPGAFRGGGVKFRGGDRFTVRNSGGPGPGEALGLGSTFTPRGMPHKIAGSVYGSAVFLSPSRGRVRMASDGHGVLTMARGEGGDFLGPCSYNVPVAINGQLQPPFKNWGRPIQPARYGRVRRRADLARPPSPRALRTVVRSNQAARQLREINAIRSDLGCSAHRTQLRRPQAPPSPDHAFHEYLDAVVMETVPHDKAATKRARRAEQEDAQLVAALPDKPVTARPPFSPSRPVSPASGGRGAAKRVSHAHAVTRLERMALEMEQRMAQAAEEEVRAASPV